MADDVIHDTRVVANLSSGNTRAKYYLSWSVNTAREIADFARAVVRYRAEQEAAAARPVLEWKTRVERGFILAKRDRSQKFWRKAEVEAREAITICQNVEEMNCEEATAQKDFWIEMAHIAELKALAMSSCDRKSRSLRTERMNTVMKMTREKFESPVSQAMKEFIAHPNEATLRATGKSFIMTMTASEAEESLEAVEVFAKVSTDAAEFGRRRSMHAATQENLDWCEAVTRDIVEFARAVAAFKTIKQP
ncbi:MAG: hypothetical protein A3F67_06680 [Verrucomicrobia bacterium RIFCSPHIGHO2_12_FULL_41_10]|nr:MAG: hypothetical protein A3F67_06680 [Verrucomicrobia bacterium RIFCSPHIGHO2_12_FULL_41_10]